MTFVIPKPWTPEEVQILRDTYPHHGMKTLLERLPGRTRFGIASKARDMGIKAGKEVFKLRGHVKLQWPAKDVESLKRIYSTASANELREAFPKRSLAAIHKQAEKFQLARDHEAKIRSRADAARYTATVNKKHPSIDELPDPFQTIVIRPAPVRDRHIVFEAISQRTPLEQAWCGQ